MDFIPLAIALAIWWAITGPLFFQTLRQIRKARKTQKAFYEAARKERENALMEWERHP